MPAPECEDVLEGSTPRRRKGHKEPVPDTYLGRRLHQIRKTREKKQKKALESIAAHQSAEAEKLAQLRALFESTKQQGVLQGAALPPGMQLDS